MLGIQLWGCLFFSIGLSSSLMFLATKEKRYHPIISSFVMLGGALMIFIPVLLELKTI